MRYHSAVRLAAGKVIIGWQNISVSHIICLHDMSTILKMRYWWDILYNWTEYRYKTNNTIGSSSVFRFVWESNVNGMSTVYIGSKNRGEKTVAFCEKYKHIVFFVIHIILMDISCTAWYVYGIIIYSFTGISLNKRCCRYNIILYAISISRIDSLFVQRRVRFRTNDIIWSTYPPAPHSIFFCEPRSISKLSPALSSDLLNAWTLPNFVMMKVQRTRLFL